jgi:simple sugar transport system permease protein
MMEDFTFFILLLDATLRVSVPLVLASMAGLFSERTGVIDIGLEGKMLGAAFAAAAAAVVTGSAWGGLAAGISVSVGLALLHGFACVSHNGNQVVSGVAINILMSGLTIILGIAWFSQGGRTPQLSGDARFKSLDLPGANAVADVPVLGQIYSELISGHNLFVYVAFLAVPLTWWVIYKTRFGLRVRAVGESPYAVDTAGIAVKALRYRALIVGGVLCGIAGTYLSTAQNAAFYKDMTAGKGFIALAALIFGKWKPVPAMIACLLFGFLEAVAARVPSALTVKDASPLVTYSLKALPLAIEAMPYILVVLLLAGFVGKAVAPKFIGVPYVKEH